MAIIVQYYSQVKVFPHAHILSFNNTIKGDIDMGLSSLC